MNESTAKWPGVAQEFPGEIVYNCVRMKWGVVKVNSILLWIDKCLNKQKTNVLYHKKVNGL